MHIKTPITYVQFLFVNSISRKLEKKIVTNGIPMKQSSIETFQEGIFKSMEPQLR